MIGARARHHNGLASRNLSLILRLSFRLSLTVRDGRSHPKPKTNCWFATGRGCCCSRVTIAHLLSLSGDLLCELARGADDERRHALAVPSRGGPLDRGDQERDGLARAGFRLRQDVNACDPEDGRHTYSHVGTSSVCLSLTRDRLLLWQEGMISRLARAGASWCAVLPVLRDFGAWVVCPPLRGTNVLQLVLV